MRVVMVTHAYPRWEGDVPGAFIARLAEALVAGGHTVAVVAPADRGNARRFTLNGVDVVQVRYAAPPREDLAYTGAMMASARTPSGLWAFLSLVRALAAGAEAEARRLQADVVHAHWWIPAGWAATGRGTPTVVTLHGTDVALLRGLPARLLGRRVLGRARRVTAVSTYLAAEARRRTWRPELAIDVVPLPIEIATFARRSRGGGGIAVLGRLTRQKRVDLLLRAVHAGRIAAPVTIVGDGAAREELERLAAHLDLAPPQVRFVGAVPPAQVPDALGDADVLAFLAQREGLGLAAAEALMLGIPVVAAADGGGVLDVVRDGAGSRVVPPVPDAIAAALASFLGKGNAAAREAAHREGEALRARLSPAAVARRFEQVYRGCA